MALLKLAFLEREKEREREEREREREREREKAGGIIDFYGQSWAREKNREKGEVRDRKKQRWRVS